jgi:hypothetical protein
MGALATLGGPGEEIAMRALLRHITMRAWGSLPADAYQLGAGRPVKRFTETQSDWVFIPSP